MNIFKTKSLYLTSLSLGYLISRLANRSCRKKLNVYNPETHGRNYSDNIYDLYATFILLSLELILTHNFHKYKNQNIFKIAIISSLPFSSITLLLVYFTIDSKKALYLGLKKNIFKKNPQFPKGFTYSQYLFIIILLYFSIASLSLFIQNYLHTNVPYNDKTLIH